MARLLTIDVCSVALRNSLLSTLRTCDEAILLPQSTQSVESGSFKNIAFRICGATTGVNPSVFAQDWFTGASLVRIRGADVAKIEAILRDTMRRREMLRALADRIQSEVADPSLQVGPSLESDEYERDIEDSVWASGFDSPSSFVGVFSAQHSKVPEGGSGGMRRVHNDFFLVCRAGAGVAASTFHSRLVAAIQKGHSLDSALDGDDGQPGARALRRLAMAGARNRSRILLDAVDVLGLTDVPSVGDQAARNKHRGVVADVDTVANTIRKLDDVPRSTYQYSACIDGTHSKGLIALSNQADGVVLFLNESGEHKISLKNEMWSCAPFTSKRKDSARAAVDSIVKMRKEGVVHPDAEWIEERFSWHNRSFSKGDQLKIEPFGLWGVFSGESFAQEFSRELGISSYQCVRLRPELVCSAGVESGKLRAIIKAVS